METPGRPFREGDRVEWVGPAEGGLDRWPKPGERGWLVGLDSPDELIRWDEAHWIAGWDVRNDPRIVAVEEADAGPPPARLPDDPIGPDLR